MTLTGTDTIVGFAVPGDPPGEYSNTLCLRTRLVREQYHRLLLARNMDDQASEQPGKEGQFVLFLAEDHLLNLHCPGLLLLLIVKPSVHEM